MRLPPGVDAESDAARPVEVTHVDDGVTTRRTDVAATEEPLEIRLGASPFVVIMRTPGNDRELAAGFLFSERIVDHRDDIAAIRHCTDKAGNPANVLNVWLAGESASRATRALSHRRAVQSNSSCGICGRRSIDDLLGSVGRCESTWTLAPDVIAAMPSALRAAQKTFDETGGLHAAGLFIRDGRLVASAEDVGRHNAVDKVIGAQLLLGRMPLSDHVLFVSGRTSFEIVQKAVVAGIPVVAAVSAPSSLAIQLAHDANVTLLGFVRGRMCNLYSGSQRLEAQP